MPHPFEILYIGKASSAQAYHVRSTILVGAGSQASVVETYVGNGPGWTNDVVTVDVGEGATLRHVKIQAGGIDSIHLAVTRVKLAATAAYDAFALICGARLSRQDIQVSMAGKSANMTLNGAYLLHGEQEATIAPVMDHLTTGCQANELMKGVLAGHSHGVFQGTLIVRPGADFTDAHQLNRNLMMSRTSRIDTKPELKIDADEVKCSHGATVGDLDDAALFYLLARGIDPQTARHMLVEAFVADVFDVAALAPDIDAHARRLDRPRGPGAVACMLDPDALAQAACMLECAIATKPQLIVISRFGNAEADGRGMRSEFADAICSGAAVQFSLLNDLEGFLGSPAYLLPPSASAIAGWAASIIADSGEISADLPVIG